MNVLSKLTNLQLFTWIVLWFFSRSLFVLGIFDLPILEPFWWSKRYLDGEIELWNLPFTLALDFFVEIVCVFCMYFIVGVVLLWLSALGLRKYLEKFFGSTFRSENF